MLEWLSQNKELITAAATTVAAFATLFGVVTALWIAKATISSQRSMSRERATLETLIRIELDEDYITKREQFNTFVRPGGEDLIQLLNHYQTSGRKKSNPAGTDTVPALSVKQKIDALRLILDIYELLGLSIAKHSLAEDVYYDWFRGQLLKDWSLTRDFILNVRSLNQNRRLYRHFEWLAVRWGGERTRDFKLMIKTFDGPIYTFLEPPSARAKFLEKA